MSVFLGQFHLDEAPGQCRFDIACGLHKQGRERAVLLDQDAMFIEPSLELLHEICAIRAPREPLLEPAHDIATLMFGHRHETERLIGDHLLVEECTFARFVEGATTFASDGLETYHSRLWADAPDAASVVKTIVRYAAELFMVFSVLFVVLPLVDR